MPWHSIPNVINQFVSLLLVIGSFRRYYPSFCFMLHYSLEASLLSLYQFLLHFSYLELIFERPTRSLPPLPGLGSCTLPGLPFPYCPIYNIRITSLFTASESEGLLPSFCWGPHVKACVYSLASHLLFVGDGFPVMLWDDGKYSVLLPGQAL